MSGEGAPSSTVTAQPNARAVAATSSPMKPAPITVTRAVPLAMRSLRSTSKEAYFVKVDSETTTEDDQAAGNVNVLVGFCPLRPAEFVVVKLSQKTQGEG